jgi:hypothetical protein
MSARPMPARTGDYIQRKLPEPARIASEKTDETEKKETRLGKSETETFVVNNL